MRKDLHIGLAIGGVLLAVLVVWGVAVNNSKKHKQVTLETNVPGGSGSEIPPAPMTPPTAPGQETPGTNGIAPPSPMQADTGASTSPVTPTDKKVTNWGAILDGTGALPTLAVAGPTSTPPAASTDDSATKKDDSSAGAKPEITTPPPAGNDGQTGPVAGDTGGGPTIPAPPKAFDPPPPVHVDAPAARTHTIQKGETFSSISKAVYGDSRYYEQIAQANPKINPNRLRPGTVINLPDAAEVKSSSKPEAKPAATASDSAKPAPAASPIDSQKSYRVVAGDSLYKISVHLYGSSEEVDNIYALNKDAIGPDKARLKLGMVLKIPAPPTVATASR